VECHCSAKLVGIVISFAKNLEHRCESRSGVIQLPIRVFVCGETSYGLIVGGFTFGKI
jgi:hypothetical protein